MKRTIALLFALLIALLGVIPAYAADYGCDVATSTGAFYMENLDTGNVVYTKNATELMYPASTTKIMTFIIVTENVDDVENTRVDITESALADLDPESSVMGLSAHIGESVTVLDLLYGLMVPSGNDAALVLSNYVGGSVSGFVDMMNQKAAQLSCKNTHFTSPHGLFDEHHYSTAEDMATITKYAMKKPLFNEICNTTRYTVSSYSDSPDETIETTNYMIDESQKGGYYYYPYAKGIKTGYTDEAGRCLVSTAEKDGYHYLLVALSAPYSFDEDINYAMLDSASLYDWAFENIAFQVIKSKDEVVDTVPVIYVWKQTSVSIVPKEDISALLPKNYDPSRVSTKAECVDEIEAPVKLGDVCGKLEVYFDGELIGTTDLIASESVDRDITRYAVHKIRVFITDHLALTIILFVAVLILIIVIALVVRAKKIEKRRRERRHRYR